MWPGKGRYFLSASNARGVKEDVTGVDHSVIMRYRARLLHVISLVLHQIKFCLLHRCNADGFSSKAGLLATHFSCKNVVFPAQDEYSYFSADFRLKMFLYFS